MPNRASEIRHPEGVASDCCTPLAVMPLVYDQLRQVARRCMASERGNHTLQATALVHEAYVRLAGTDAGGDGAGCWTGRAHFLRAAAEAMRHILVDHARARKAVKRGGARGAQWERLAYSVVDLAASQDLDPALILDLDEALDELDAQEPHLAEVVRLRFFAGLTVEEVASALGVSPRTVKSDWSFARAWLFRRLEC